MPIAASVGFFSPRNEQHQGRLAARPRRRAVGAGAKHKFVFVDRLPATLVSPRHGTTHDVPACWFGVDRSTITRAIGEVRPLLAQRGCTVAPGIRLGSLAEVIEHLGTDGRTGITDGTEIRVRRPAAGRKDRDRFVSGRPSVVLQPGPTHMSDIVQAVAALLSHQQTATLGHGLRV
ncbi:transposase family protein [Streptomyces canus]|uniref:helix-turn-helix domain-containing protein n=1 Tax=Streptomyces canus TaxID=58343 RepID=UPI003687B5EF